jgi:DNA-binding NarL/FixJ family response regulator
MQQRKRRVLVISRHPLFREGLGRVIRGEEGFELLGTCASIDEARLQSGDDAPDLIIVDGKQGKDLSASDLAKTLDMSASQVLSLSLSDPDMTVYTREQITEGSVEDLLRSLRGGS